MVNQQAAGGGAPRARDATRLEPQVCFLKFLLLILLILPTGVPTKAHNSHTWHHHHLHHDHNHHNRLLAYCCHDHHNDDESGGAREAYAFRTPGIFIFCLTNIYLQVRLMPPHDNNDETTMDRARVANRSRGPGKPAAVGGARDVYGVASRAPDMFAFCFLFILHYSYLFRLHLIYIRQQRVGTTTKNR
jgi:hypothetical protein